MKRILIIAGSDCSGGAGIQADIKTVTALGGYAMSAITAITVQNTLGVSAVHAVPLPIIRGQIEACLTDIGADCIKIGMLLNAEIIEAVEAALFSPHPNPLPKGEGTCSTSPIGRGRNGEAISGEGTIPIILDPVMVATSGAKLLDDSALGALKKLMAIASLITPNIPEAELLTGLSIATRDDMLGAAKKLYDDGSERCAILLKGGHLAGDTVHDLLYQGGEAFWYESPKIITRHTHGTGCTLASAVATIGAQGNPLFVAVERARDYVHQAISTAPHFGAGNGPLNHCLQSS